MKIVLDFDDTIFNTYGLMQEFLKIFLIEGFNEEQFWDVYRQCKKKIGDFDKDIFVDLIYSLKNFNKEEINKKIDFIINKSNEFVYRDFFDFVSSFKKEKLILLSFGTTEFQKTKIENSGISKYFSEIIITSRNKADDMEEIQKKYNGSIVFIEDKAKAIDDVKKRLPNVIAMKMIRAQGGHTETKSELTNYIIQDLNKLEGIINNLRD
ncbi:MAG: HAD family hydrolase [Patescibacteria group bacterium]|nr:HAD family hydrolase [Patescibacteria group bacterium]